RLGKVMEGRKLDSGSLFTEERIHVPGTVLIDVSIVRIAQHEVADLLHDGILGSVRLHDLKAVLDEEVMLAARVDQAVRRGDLLAASHLVGLAAGGNRRS